MVSPLRLQDFKVNIEKSLIKLFTPEKKMFKIQKEIPYDKEESKKVMMRLMEITKNPTTEDNRYFYVQRNLLSEQH